MEYFEHVKEVTPIDNHRLAVRFAGGSRGVFDCSRYMQDRFWEHLREESYFRQVSTDHGVLTWPDGTDIAPEEVWEGTVRESAAE